MVRCRHGLPCKNHHAWAKMSLFSVHLQCQCFKHSKGGSAGGARGSRTISSKTLFLLSSPRPDKGQRRSFVGNFLNVMGRSDGLLLLCAQPVRCEAGPRKKSKRTNRRNREVFWVAAPNPFCWGPLTAPSTTPTSMTGGDIGLDNVVLKNKGKKEK